MCCTELVVCLLCTQATCWIHGYLLTASVAGRRSGWCSSTCKAQAMQPAAKASGLVYVVVACFDPGCQGAGWQLLLLLQVVLCPLPALLPV